jgi:hypothetical protein
MLKKEKPNMKKKSKILTTVFAMLLCVALTISLAACGGGNGDNNDGGNTGIGSNPSLPSYSQTAPASAAALVTSLVTAGYTDAEAVATGIVYGTKTANGKDYEYYGINTVASAANEYALITSAYRQMFDTFKSLNGSNKDALKAALTEDGITNFNISSDAMSWTDSEGSYSIAIRGDWVLVEVITAASGGDHTHSFSSTWHNDADGHWQECSCGAKQAFSNHVGNPCSICGYTAQSGNRELGEYSLPTNVKIVLNRGSATNNGTTVIKVGSDYYGFALSNSGLTGAHRYLKYNSGSNDWKLYTGSGTVLGNPSSGWSAIETVTASGLKEALQHIGFFNFTLSTLVNVASYSEIDTDTVCGRPVTVYSNGGTNVLYVDDGFGIVLKAQIGYGNPYQVTEITTTASMLGVSIPSDEVVGLELPSAQIFNSFGINRSTLAAVSLSGTLTTRNFFEGVFMMLAWNESNVSDFNAMRTYFINAGWTETNYDDDEDYPEFTATKGDFEVWLTYSSDSSIFGLTIS